MQPVGSVPIPDGPAQTWIVADLDSGQVLAGRDQNVPHPPASTIKVLLALVALDQVSLDTTVVADAADAAGRVQLRRRQSGPHLHRPSTPRGPAAGLG